MSSFPCEMLALAMVLHCRIYGQNFIEHLQYVRRYSRCWISSTQQQFFGAQLALPAAAKHIEDLVTFSKVSHSRPLWDDSANQIRIGIWHILKLNFKVKFVICFCFHLQWHCAHTVSIMGLILEHDSAVLQKYFPHKVNEKDLRPVLWIKNQQYRTE